jgi:hypothetical protein
MIQDLVLGDLDLADIEITVTARAWHDEPFRRRLLADPKGTIEQETGVRLAPDLRLSVHEETAQHRHLVIPARPSRDD